MKSSITCSTQQAALDFVANLVRRGYTETHGTQIKPGRFRRTFAGGVFIVEWRETREHEAEAEQYELEVLRTMALRKSTDGKCRWDGCNRRASGPESGLCKSCLARLGDLEGRVGRAA